jgi:selenocysteine lyase/cysteine desulfurase
VAVGVLALLMGFLPRAGGPQTTTATAAGNNAAELYARRYDRFWPTPERRAELDAARARFLSHASQAAGYGYGAREAFEGLVAREMGRFADQVYVDYTGSGVYQETQLRAVMEELGTTTYGNAHSRNPSALATEHAVEAARRMVLRHFNVTAAEYSVIFTSGATGALKLVAESFPWTNASKFVYLRQNHNSVLGIREVALDQGATFVAIPESEMNEDTCNKWIGGAGCKGERSRKVALTPFPDNTYNLFAFPAQDNFAGVKYPLEWVNMFHGRDRGEHGTGNWLVLLDAAAYVPTNALDLHTYPADFVTISFYKIFGYPTGLGALLVRNEVVDVMQKTFFGGGTVVLSSCDTHFCLLHQNPCSRFEDGTISFLSIAALRHGFNALQAVAGLSGAPAATTSTPAAVMAAINRHVTALTRFLYEELAALKHSNGKPVLEVYGKHDEPDRQGAIVNFNVLSPEGKHIGYHVVQSVTADAQIHLRTGCNCNPGACYDYLGVTSAEVMRYSLEKKSCGDELDVTSEGKPLGAVRISLGYLSTLEDVIAVIDVIRTNFAK